MIKFQATKFASPEKMESPVLGEGLKGIIVYRDPQGHAQVRLFGDIEATSSKPIMKELVDIINALPNKYTIQRWPTDFDGLSLYLRKYTPRTAVPE